MVSLMTDLDNALALRAGKRLVFTNGVFDLFHPGHLRFLQQACAMGDLLIVGVNETSDKRLQGPYIDFKGRKNILLALRYVDAVVGFRDTIIGAAALVDALRPEVYVKGSEYRGQGTPESVLVKAYGGFVAYVERPPDDYSTTKLLAAIRSRRCPRCQGVGSVGHCLAWDGSADEIDCSMCQGRGTIPW